MKNFVKMFNDYDGLNFIRQCLYCHLFLFAVTELLRLGVSKKSLEILRNSVHFKYQRKLKKKYSETIKLYSRLHSNSDQKRTDIVWFCWLQGIECAPKLVRQCYDSIEKNVKDKNIILITEENILEYSSLPEFIINKWKNGIISNTHLSDLLRLNLLINHGGTWIDATVYISDDKYSDVFFNSDLFVFQELKPGRDGHALFISSWFMSAKINSPILIMTYELLLEYWRKDNRLKDYYLMHHFFCISTEVYSSEWNRVPKYCNSIPHVLLLELFDKYDARRLEEIWKMSSVHKLTYKFADDKLDESYYKTIFD